jgi:hypothetical protein
MLFLLACFLDDSRVVVINEGSAPLQAQVVVQSGQGQRVLWQGQVEAHGSHELEFSPSADGLVQLIRPGSGAPVVVDGGYTTHGDDSVHRFVVDASGQVTYTQQVAGQRP